MINLADECAAVIRQVNALAAAHEGQTGIARFILGVVYTDVALRDGLDEQCVVDEIRHHLDQASAHGSGPLGLAVH